MPPPTTAIYLNSTTPASPPGNQNVTFQSDGAQPEQSITAYPQLATATLMGVGMPDGLTLQVVNGVWSVIAPGTGTGGGTGGGSASGGALVVVVPSGAKDGTNTQFTLPAPVLAGNVPIYFRNGAAQRQLGLKAEFGVQGTTLTTTTPLQPDPNGDWHEFYYVQGTPNSEGGGGGTTTPVGSALVRGSGQAASISASSLTLSLSSLTAPGGGTVAAQAGDLAVLFFADSYQPAIPSGWTSLNTFTGGTLKWIIASKILTSADISTGSITANQSDPPFGPIASNCALSIAVLIGPTGGVGETEVPGTVGAPAYTNTNTTTGAVINTDVAIYFACMIGSSGQPVPVITPASGSARTLQSTGSVAGMLAVLADQAMPGGALAVGTYFVNSTSMAAQVIVKGS
jgi:hypothetical protein